MQNDLWPLAAKLRNLVSGQPAPPSVPDEALLQRLDGARDAAIQSYRNRLGRDPSEDELGEALREHLQPSDREELNNPWLPADAVLAGFKRSPAKRGPRTSPPAEPPLPPPSGMPPDFLVAAKTLISLMTSDPQGLSKALESSHPLVRGLAVLRVLPILENERWLNSLGVDRALMKAADAQPSQLQMSLGQLYDAWKGWDDRWFDVYAKERLDTGDCRFDPGTKKEGQTCVYVGHTSGHETSDGNVLERFKARYPTNQYDKPVAFRRTKSLSAAVGEEGNGINHYRKERRSDNKYRAFSPSSPLAEYYRFQALKEFGPFVPPIP